MSDLLSALEPVQESVIKLSHHNSNLLIAEAAVKFIHQSLSSLQSSFALELLESVMARYNARRNEEIISLLLFLHTGSYPKSSSIFEYSNKTTIKRTASKLMDRLFPVVTTPSQEVQSGAGGKPSMQDGINELTKRSDKVEGSLEKDFKLLEALGEKSVRLNHLHQALLTIQPTSTSCEQVFSVAGSFKTKVRNRMSPEKLGILVWLKYFFTKRLQM